MPINPQYAVGIDIYQGNGIFDPAKATERIEFVIAQANRGLYRDKQFRANHDACNFAKIPFMAYNQYVAGFGWQLQRDLLLELCANTNTRAVWWAYDSAGLNQGKLNAGTAKETVAAVTSLSLSSPYFAGIYGNPTDIAQLYKDAPDAKNFPLWLARYSVNQTQWNETQNIMPNMLLPHIPFVDNLPWLAWQYASELNWLGHETGRNYGLESYSVDINCWLGGTDIMREMLGITTPHVYDWKKLYMAIPFRPI